MSGCAFSTSSSRITLCGALITASVSRPPDSCPTYPGGAPISRDAVCFSMYSLMSKRCSGTPSAAASRRASSVLPTPLGPTNRNDPIGCSGSRMPAMSRLTARITCSMAGSWPNTPARRAASIRAGCSRVAPVSASSGRLVMRATTRWMSRRSIVRVPAPSRPRCLAAEPASSSTSIALSGRRRSAMCRSESSTAARSARGL